MSNHAGASESIRAARNQPKNPLGVRIPHLFRDMLFFSLYIISYTVYILYTIVVYKYHLMAVIDG